MKKILLMRHGETNENACGLYAGHIDATLSENGKRQIELLTARMRQERIDHIFSSDLTRAMLTAEPIARHHGLELKISPLLREKSGGIFESRPFEDYIAECQRSQLPLLDFCPQGGESLRTVGGRAMQFLQSAIAPLPGPCSIAVMAHGGFNKMFLALLLGMDAEAAIGIEQDNTCVNILELDGDLRLGHCVLNSTLHLR